MHGLFTFVVVSIAGTPKNRPRHRQFIFLRLRFRDDIGPQSSPSIYQNQVMYHGPTGNLPIGRKYLAGPAIVLR
jgi:hypothetical protein